MGTLTPNAAHPSPLPGAGSYCHKAEVLNNTEINEYSRWPSGLDVNVSYVHGDIYFEAVADGSAWRTMELADSGGNPVAYILVERTGGSYSWDFYYYDNGMVSSGAPQSFSTGSWIERLEYMYNVTTMLWEVQLGSITIASGAIATSARIPKEARVGIMGNNANAISTVYTDNFKWGTNDWAGGDVVNFTSTASIVSNVLCSGMTGFINFSSTAVIVLYVVSESTEVIFSSTSSIQLAVSASLRRTSSYTTIPIPESAIRNIRMDTTSNKDAGNRMVVRYNRSWKYSGVEGWQGSAQLDDYASQTIYGVITREQELPWVKSDNMAHHVLQFQIAVRSSPKLKIEIELYWGTTYNIGDYVDVADFEAGEVGLMTPFSGRSFMVTGKQYDMATETITLTLTELP